MRIDYDDDALTIIEKVNAALRNHGLAFFSDEQEHDGFELFELRSTAPKEGTDNG